MISPAALFLRFSLVWLFLAALAPFSFSFKYEVYPAILVVGISLFFLFGCQFGKIRLFDGSARPEKNAVRFKVWIGSPSFWRVFWTAVVVAAIGCAIRAYDRLIVRDLISAASTTEARLSLLDAGESSGGISVVAAIMFPWAYSVFFLGQLVWKTLKRKQRLLVLAISSYPVLEGFAQGGIIAPATTLLYYYFCSKALIGVGIAPERKSRPEKLKTLLVLCAAISGAALIFLDRVQSMFGDLVLYMQLAEMDGTIVYSDSAYWIVEVFGIFGFVVVWLMHYFTLGLHEFFYLVQNFDGDNHFYGEYQLYIPIKLIKFFGFFSSLSAESFYRANPMPGHYQTFWGPAYMDFGTLVFVEAFLVGVFSGVFHRNCQRGLVSGLILYPYLQASLILGFLANGLIGERFYFFVSLTILAIVCALSVRKCRIPSSSLCST